MKKRLISLLLTLVMVFSFVSTMTVTASAENTLVITDYAKLVTVKNKDTLIGICTAMKVNYNDVKDGIMVANGFTSETQLSRLTVNETIWIPTSKANSAAIVKNAYAFDETGKAIGRSTGGGVATVNVNIPSGDVITYTVRSGDTIGKICKAHNLDYDTVKQAIVDLNPKRFSSIASLGKIQPNWVIYLPASNAAAREVNSLVSEAEREIGTTSNTTATGDTFWGYLVKHQMAYGETVKSVCNTLGMTYSTETSEMVKTLNGLKNLNNVKAGSSYWFPSKTNTGNGYVVYSHVVVAGDTCGNICSARGLNYNNVSSLLQGLNPTTNLNNIKRGQTLLVLSGKASENGGAGGINVVIGGNGGNNGNSGSSNYKILRSYITSQGSFTCLVNGTAADQAPAGSKVTISASPKAGMALDTLKYTYASGGSSITDSIVGTSFTMPASQVTVSATFVASALKVTFEQPANATLSVAVNGGTITSGTAIKTGSTIVATVTPKSGYEVKSVKANGTLMTKNYDGTWTVTGVSASQVIEAEIGATGSSVTTYNLNTTISGHGSVSFVSEGQSNIYEAAAGGHITVRINPESGYQLASAPTLSDSTPVYRNSDGTYYFTMPAKNVSLIATFEKIKYYTIKDISTASAVYSASRVYVNNATSSTAKQGDTVIVGIDFNQPMVVTWVGIPDPKNTLDIQGTTAFYKFTMPANDVTFKITAAPNGNYSISNTTNSTIAKDVYTGVRIYRNGAQASYANAGDTVSVSIDKIGNIAVDWVGIPDPASSLVINGNTATYTFTMPSGNVSFSVQPVSRNLTQYQISDISSTMNSVYSSVTIKRNGVGSTYAYQGDTVTVTIDHSKPIVVTWGGVADPAGTLVQEGSKATYTFTMPSNNVTIDIKERIS